MYFVGGPNRRMAAIFINRNKNSSGDEIANVNFLRRYGTYVLQNTNKNSSGDEIANVNFLTTISHTRRPTSKYRKRDKPTSFNKLDDR